jgi:hypothetical protein
MNLKRNRHLCLLGNHRTRRNEGRLHQRRPGRSFGGWGRRRRRDTILLGELGNSRVSVLLEHVEDDWWASAMQFPRLLRKMSGLGSARG